MIETPVRRRSTENELSPGGDGLKLNRELQREVRSKDTSVNITLLLRSASIASLATYEEDPVAIPPVPRADIKSLRKAKHRRWHLER